MFCVEEEELPEEVLPKGWDHAMQAIYDAAQNVRRAIDVYTDACRFVNKLECPEEVYKIVNRSVDTGLKRESSWSSLGDDPFVINGAFSKALKNGWKPRHMKKDE